MYPLLSATHMFPPNCPGPGKWSCLASVPCISSGIYSWLLGVRAGFSPWQSWQSGPLEGAGCPVSVSTFLRRKGPRICFTRLLGQRFGWGGCGHQLGLSLGSQECWPQGHGPALSSLGHCLWAALPCLAG